MKTKICSQCNNRKPLSDFFKNRKSDDGHTWACKSCFYVSQLEREHSFNGLINVIYTSQKSSSKRRNHPMPSYSKQELIEWINKSENKIRFNEIYNNWVKSGYDKYKKPSIDRKKSELPYTLDNIQLMTWKENESKGHYEIMNGTMAYSSKKPHRSVVGINKKTGKKIEFISAAMAAKKTGIARPNICHCCSGRLNSSGGYNWYYKDVYEKIIT